MDFSLTDEHQLLRGQVRRFAEERIAPGVAERDRARRFPAELVTELASLGLFGIFVPEEYGGAGMDMLAYALVVEELARICPATAIAVSVTNSVCCWPIWRYGTAAQRRTALRELAGGECLGGFALTEPGAGSDAGALRTVARRGSDDWVLNGEKAWITNAGLAGYYVVFAKTDPEAGKRGISAFLVPGRTPGLVVGEPEAKLGLRASRTGPLAFQDCRIPPDHLLGAEGQGFKIALATLDHSRLGIAAQAVGIHQRALELATAHARERVQFGVPIARHQAVQFKLATMATELAAARSLTYAAAAGESGPHAGRLAAQAKLYASEAANRACWEALQIHGGNGFSDEHEISRLYRDVRVTTIYEGTSEMQRLVIARQLLRH